MSCNNTKRPIREANRNELQNIGKGTSDKLHNVLSPKWEEKNDKKRGKICCVWWEDNGIVVARFGIVYSFVECWVTYNCRFFASCTIFDLVH